jgi:hypothetical protein
VRASRKWICRLELRNVLIFLIVASSIGAAFVVTVVNIVKLFWSPAIGWPQLYDRRGASYAYPSGEDRLPCGNFACDGLLIDLQANGQT